MAKKMIQKIEVQALSQILQKFAEEKVSRRFAYSAVKNRMRMQEELGAIQEVMKPLTEFDVKRLEICKECAKKDETGTPIMIDGKYAGLDGNDEFKIKFSALKDEFDPIVEEVNRILQENVEIDFYEVDLEDLPDKMTLAEVELLMPLIKDPEQDSQ